MPRRSPASTGRRCSSTTGPGSPRTPARLQAALARTGLPFRRPVRAQGEPAPRGPRGLPRPRRARRPRRASASTPARPARSSAPSRAAGARRDQLHGHERLRARPRRPARRTASTSTSTRSARSSATAAARPGRTIGIRIDPGAGAGYNEHLEYAGDRPTKFGIGLERLDDAIAAAAPPRPDVDTVHFHAGSGWLADGLAGFERRSPPAVEAVDRLRAAGIAIREVNVGGGLGRAGARRTSGPSTSTRTPRSWPAISVRSASRSRASRATS